MEPHVPYNRWFKEGMKSGTVLTAENSVFCAAGDLLSFQKCGGGSCEKIGGTKGR